MLQTRFVFLLLAGLSLLTQAAFAAGIPVRGRVLDAGGAPLAKAKVRLVPLASIHAAGRLELEGKDGPEAVASAESGADGFFLLEAPEAGMWKVVVGAADGKLVAQEARLLPLTAELDLPAARLRREGQPVRSSSSWTWQDAPRPRVRPGSGPTVPLRILGAGGKPVAGVLVLEVPSDLEEKARPLGMTGENGVVELAAPGETPLDVLLVAADGRQLEVRVRPVPAKEPRAPQETRLPALVELPVRVVSAADGRPLPGALVWRSDDPGSFRRTDGRGAASLPGGPSAVVGARGLGLQAAAPGFVPDLRQTAGQSLVSFSLQPDLALTGVVVDEAGAPVTGVEISPDVQNRPDLPMAVRMRTFGSRAALARSGPGGRFRLSGLLAGVEYELRVTKDGFAPSRVQAVMAPEGAPGRPAAPLRIVLQRGRSAFGRVLGADRQPAAGVQVTLRASVASGPDRFRAALFPENLDTFEAVTGSDGRFDLVHLPAGRYDLTARGRGWAPLTVPTLEIPDSIPKEKRATDLGTLVLAPGVAVEGAVVDTAGRPVEGAEIRVAEAVDSSFPFPLEERGEPAGTSGGDGFFRIEDLRAGSTVNLTVQRKGYAAAESKGIQVPAERPVRITLQAVAAVSGRVVDPDGEPVVGATVQLDTSRFPLISTRLSMMDRSDADGNFRLPEVIPGPLSLTAQAAGWQTGSVTGLELRSGEEKRGVEIVLARAAVLEGRVLGSSGRPVPDAQVRLAREDRQRGFHSAITDADGRYVLDSLPPGLRTVEAAHPDHGSARRQVEVRVGDSTSLDISLEAGNEVSGRVIDEDGSPVAGAQVWLGGMSGLPLNVMSRSDGGFRFASVPDGDYRAGVDKEGFARSERVPVTVSGADVSGLELRLSRGGSLVGRITGVEAAELSRVQIVASGPGMPNGGRVEPDGSYRIEHLREGEWHVRAELPGTALYAEGVARLEPGASEARLDLDLERGLELSGRVRRSGAPVSGESVFLEGAGHRRSIAQTDADGRFRFPGLAAGSYRLRLEARPGGSLHEETVDLQADREITIDLAAGEVRGRVVDAADASPLANVTVQLLAADGDAILGQERTDSRGVFVLRSVPEGSLRVRAQADGYASAEAPVRIDGGGPSSEVELSLRATEGVTLQVASAAGPPLRSVFYVVLDGAGRKIGDGTAALGEAGRVRLSRIPPGAWQVLLLSDSTAAIEIAVTAPGDAGQVILPPPCTLRVTVPALAESPVPATLSLTGPGGRPFRTFARIFEPVASWDLQRGTAALSDLPPGTWDVRVTAADGRTWRTTATTAPGAPVEAVLE